ncbi:MAG: class I SAM-dependent methyltransferase [Syntrophales bacterium]|nr:class I SAM-dependent methyltransferase [Syntrophales bacterium]
MLTVDVRKLELKKGMRVLDAGCGAGRHLCEAFREQGIEVVGLDINMEDLGKAHAMLCLMAAEKGGNWLLIKGDVTNLPFKDEVFDAVICSEVLEHICDSTKAIRELVRVLKPGGPLAVSVPRYFPERICWALSQDYHNEKGGHIRIYRKKELMALLEAAGTKCEKIRYRHALHSPYWWLKCAVGHKNDDFPLVKAYKRFLEWDIIKKPLFTRALENLLDPILAKSIVFYTRKVS